MGCKLILSDSEHYSKSKKKIVYGMPLRYTDFLYDPLKYETCTRSEKKYWLTEWMFSMFDQSKGIGTSHP